MWLAATHYFESEIINKLIGHIKIHREAIKSKILGGNILMKCSLFIAFDSLYCTKTAVAGLPCITRLLTGRVATFQTLLFARTLPVVFLHWLFIELEITIVRALILQSENPMNTIPNTLRTVQKQNRAQPHGKNWCGCLKRDLPLTKTLLHKAAVTWLL